MDCLLANYASSDEEEHEEKRQLNPPPVVSLAGEKQRSGLFNSLPPPKSSLFDSGPYLKPKRQDEQRSDEQSVEKSQTKALSSSLFSSLPPPKTSSSTFSSTTRKLVQFRPPTVINRHSSLDNDEDEDQDEIEMEKQKRKSRDPYSAASATSFLTSMPAPKDSATLGAFPSALGAGRRSMIQTDASASADNVIGTETVLNSHVSENQSREMTYDYFNVSSGSPSYGAVQVETFASAAVYRDRENDNHIDTSAGLPEVQLEDSNDLTSSYYAGDVSVYPEVVDNTYHNANYVGNDGEYMDNTQYDVNWSATATDPVMPEVSGVVEIMQQSSGKRRRKDAPDQIVEVKQDELMKNRPREDQTKMTGIAFGPAYQPTSTKGKPSKLHKRKHQIGSLYFDMRQKESEFAERRAKGYVTKAQTQAKYGW